jgi:V8-like Glu-specific endopeptidase
MNGGAMATAPVKTGDISKLVRPRPPLKEAVVKLSFEVHPQSTKPGVRVFPPPVGGTLVERRSVAPVHDEKVLQGFLPDHLALNPEAPQMDERLRIRRTFDPLAKLGKDQFMATTIFPPDQRRVFSDTSFPWCTVGRVDVTGGWGSGTLIGPRHLLCASHMMTWNADNTVNQVTFTPSYFGGSAPFGNSGIIHWYAYRKVVGPILSVDDTEEDYVVLVLNNRLGDICGWMGTRGYDSGWNGLADWDHIGYPQDIAGGTEPTFQNAIAIDSTTGGSDDEYLAQKADVIPGQSGGPFFGWWAGESWPRVVGVQSGQNSSTNSAGGGNDIPNLVNRARTDFP